MKLIRISVIAALFCAGVATSGPANAMSMVEYALLMRSVSNTPQGRMMAADRRARAAEADARAAAQNEKDRRDRAKQVIQSMLDKKRQASDCPTCFR